MLRSRRFVIPVSTSTSFLFASSQLTSQKRTLFLAPKLDSHDIKLAKIKRAKWTWTTANGEMKPHRGYTFDPSSFNRKAAEKLEKENDVGPDRLPLARKLDEEREKEAELREGKLAMKRQQTMMQQEQQHSELDHLSSTSTTTLLYQQRSDQAQEQEIIKNIFKTLPRDPFSPIDHHLWNFPSEIRRKKLEEESEKNIEVISAFSSFFTTSANNSSENSNNQNSINNNLQLIEILSGTVWDLLRELLSPSALTMTKRAKETAIHDYLSFGQSLGDELLELDLASSCGEFFLTSSSSSNNNNKSNNNTLNLTLRKDTLRLISNARLALYYDNFFTGTFQTKYQPHLSELQSKLLFALREDVSENELFRDEMIYYFMESSNDGAVVSSLTDFDQFQAKFMSNSETNREIYSHENLDIFGLVLRSMMEQRIGNVGDVIEIDDDDDQQQHHQISPALKNILFAFSSALDGLMRNSLKNHREIQNKSTNRGFGHTPVDGVVLKTAVKSLAVVLSSPHSFDPLRMFAGQPPNHLQSFLHSTISRSLSSLEQLFEITPNFELPVEAIIDLGKSLNQTFFVRVNNNDDDDANTAELLKVIDDFRNDQLASFFTKLLLVLTRCEKKLQSLPAQSLLDLITNILANEDVLSSLSPINTNTTAANGKKTQLTNEEQEEYRAQKVLKSYYGTVLRKSIELLPSVVLSSNDLWRVKNSQQQEEQEEINQNDNPHQIILHNISSLLTALSSIHEASFYKQSGTSLLKMDIEIWKSLVGRIRGTLDELVRTSEDRDYGSLLRQMIEGECRQEFAQELMVLRVECVFDPLNKRELLPLSKQEKKMQLL